MKLKAVLLGLVASFAFGFDASEANAWGRRHSPSTHSSGYSNYSGTGHRYHVYAAYPSGYQGTAPISRLYSGSFYLKNSAIWAGAHPGVYVTGSSLYGGPVGLR